MAWTRRRNPVVWLQLRASVASGGKSARNGRHVAARLATDRPGERSGAGANKLKAERSGALKDRVVARPPVRITELAIAAEDVPIASDQEPMVRLSHQCR
jgi:hypothetical protein